MSKLDQIKGLGPSEIGRRYGAEAEMTEREKQARIEKLREKLAALEGAKPPQVRKYASGGATPKISYVKELRLSTGKTQAQFAEEHGFNRRSLEGWESGRSHPGKAARTKLEQIRALHEKAKEGK